VDLRSEVDGYRALALKQGKDIRLLSLKEKNLSSDFPGVVEAVGAIGGAFTLKEKTEPRTYFTLISIRSCIVENKKMRKKPIGQ
jgi:ATP-dependent DNA ligase